MAQGRAARATALVLLTGAVTLAILLTTSAEAGENGEPAAVPVAATEEAQPYTATVAGIASDWAPSRCYTDRVESCVLPTIALTVSSADGTRSVDLTVEIASQPDQRQRGLMFRESLDEFAGMLFVFSHDQYGGFWMRNTLIPLDIAYLGADGTVLEIVHGRPLDLTVLRPSQPYRYTLEMNAGWFERNGFGPGDRVEIPPGLPEAP